MVEGYNKFPHDVQSVFADTIRNYNFTITLAEPDAVALINNKVQIGFSINEELLSMSVKSGEKFYNVRDLVQLIDKEFYYKWNNEVEAAIKNSGREEYYKAYLFCYRQLSDKYLLQTYATGLIPSQNEYEKMRESRNEHEKTFSTAWNAMQKLDYSHPIRQKYILNDPSWMNDMINLIEKGEFNT